MKRYLFAALGIAVLFTGAYVVKGLPFQDPKVDSVPFGRSPKEVLERLIDGNQRYAANQFESPDRASMRRMEVSKEQTPFAVVVGCSDSRVPPEIIFDQGLGDLFVVRVAGQVVGPIELDTIEYGHKYLGASLVFILGHQSCGAVTAVLDGKTEDIEEIAELIQPAISSGKDKSVEQAVKDNVHYVVDHLEKSSLIEKMQREGKVKVVGGYYQLFDGKVEILH